MLERPSRLWRDLPPAKRVLAAQAFWEDRESPEIAAQHSEAVAILARRLNFRARSIQSMALDRRARHLAQATDIPDSIATRALIAYHFTTQRSLMSAFLDALGIGHDNGLITDENVSPPSRAQLEQAVEAVRASFASDDVELYLHTLVVLDGDTWVNLEGILVGPA